MYVRAVLPRSVLILVGCCETEAGVVHEAACWAMRQVIGACATSPSAGGGGQGAKEAEEVPAAIKDAMTATMKLLDYR